MAVLLIGVAALVFLMDVLMKQSVVENVGDSEERYICGGRLILRKVYNKGIAMNVFSSRPQMVKIVSAVMGVYLIIRSLFLLGKKGRKAETAAALVLTGGAWSNIFDRLVRGKVVDYLAIRSENKKVRDITFNIGDVCIFAGAILVYACRSVRAAFRKERSGRRKKGGAL